MTKAHVIRLVIEHSMAGMVFASSPDVRELNVAGHTVEGAKEAAALAIAALYEMRGETVDVHELEADDGAGPRLVVVRQYALAQAC